jgi:hypothetical protein
MMPLKLGPKVRAKRRTRQGFSDDFIPAGRTGNLLAERKQDNSMLIKWHGKAWPSAHDADDIEYLIASETPAD